MRRLLAPFVVCFVVWLVATAQTDAAAVAVGLVVSFFVAYLLTGLEIEEVPLLLVPDRLWFALAYVPWLLFMIAKANVDVAYRVLHPKLPIRPGIVRVRTSLASRAARVLLANSLTLTPGTLSVDLVGDTLYVHRIFVPSDDPEGHTKRGVEEFEKRIRRIFE